MPLTDDIASRFGVAPRPAQVDAIVAALAGRDLLVVLPTGGGKSLCYQAPAWIRAARGEGPTVVISPLIALIDDQVARCRALGLRAIGVHTGVPAGERDLALREASAADLVFLSPERAASPRFRRWLQGARVAGLVVDEAHCISEWGHDFRPEYARLGELRALTTCPVSAFTATASPRVRGEIKQSLQLLDPFEHTGAFTRENLELSVEHLSGDRARFARVVAELDALGLGRRGQAGRAVVYAASRNRVTAVGTQLKKMGFLAGWYHAGRTDGARRRAADAFDGGTHTVLVATSAFGMGIDHPDVRLVAHLQAPGSLEAYYPPAGRAGRDGRPSRCILWFGPSDALIQAKLRGAWPGAASGWSALTAYAWGTTCRQATISRWFEPTRDVAPCGVCDVCRGGSLVAASVATARQEDDSRRAVRTARARADSLVPVEDGAKEKIVAFVGALRRPLSRTAIAAGLRGSRARRLLRLKVDENPEFGALRHLPERALVRALDELLADERLAPRGKKYPTLWLPGKPVRSAATVARPVTGGLITALKNYRKVEARRRRWKAYQVFPDATVAALDLVRPTTLTLLESIPGLGPKRIERFGVRILEIVAKAD